MSDTFEWKDEYCVGEEILDNQHKYMFEQGNRITTLQPEETKRLIIDLYRYIMQHFTTEEAHMTAIGYPGVDKHRQQHEFIIDQLDKMLSGFIPDPRNTLKLKLFLFNWLTTHILREDKKYFDFANATKLASELKK
ncbi:MAG: hemerythrin family protein [Deltaproteobacteria bacterium]|nr:hemerythrin family protein [Deltaproteobacteria bacterium]